MCPSQDSTNKCGYMSFRWLTGQGHWAQISWVKLLKNIGPYKLNVHMFSLKFHLANAVILRMHAVKVEIKQF